MEKVVKISREEFEEIVYRGLEELPGVFKEFLNNVAVVVENAPSKEIRRKLNLKDGDLLFGLYEGVALTNRSFFSPLSYPARITIYMNPILSVSKNEEDVKNRIIKTVIHEIAHHFGMGDDYLHSIGY